MFIILLLDGKGLINLDLGRLKRLEYPNVKLSLSLSLYERFKVVAQKDERKYSNIVEGAMRRYVQSKL